MKIFIYLIAFVLAVSYQIWFWNDYSNKKHQVRIENCIKNLTTKEKLSEYTIKLLCQKVE